MSTLFPQALKNLREIRIHFSPASPSSKGIQQFLLQNYKTIKSKHPNIPVLIREFEQVESAKASSIIYTRWPEGVEKSLVLDGMDEKKVASSLKKLLDEK